MISDFPSDPMHLIFLGIVNKIVVSLWCCGKPTKTKLFFRQMSEISKLLINQRENISFKFNRKSRSLFESKRWKATEFRTFLLYTGPVVLILIIIFIINYDQYLNFLHITITILSNSFNSFCQTYETIFRLFQIFIAIFCRNIYYFIW